MVKISGVYSAALTPLKTDLSINQDLYLRHCQYLMNQGHDGLAIFGTTGEANSLSVKEKKENLEEIGRKEPLRCFTRHDLQAHQTTVAKLIAAQPHLPIAAQSILHDLLDHIHQLAL